jgi:acyl-CoA synthetase (NDP forming)
VARLVDYMVDDEATRVICLFLETTRDTATLAAAARRALAAGKPVVALKIGTSPVTAKAAQAHTGSLVGDDRVFDAACRQLGIIRVHSIDDLVATAALLSRLRPRGGGNVAAIAISGGICEIAADRAEASGLTLPELSVRSREALGDVLPSFGTPHNPLDLTGAAILDPALFARSIEVLDQDPEIGLIACLYDLPTEPRHGYSQQVIQQVGQAFSAASTPGCSASHRDRCRISAGCWPSTMVWSIWAWAWTAAWPPSPRPSGGHDNILFPRSHPAPRCRPAKTCNARDRSGRRWISW